MDRDRLWDRLERQRPCNCQWCQKQSGYIPPAPPLPAKPPTQGGSKP